jgi:hypothetical protein
MKEAKVHHGLQHPKKKKKKKTNFIRNRYSGRASPFVNRDTP